MKTIAYTGTSDFQQFDKADFDKAGVEDGKKIRFARNEPTEVEDSIAEVLLSKEGIFGDFSFTDVSDAGSDADTDGEETEEQRAAAQKAAKKAAKKAASSSDSSGAQTGAGATAQSAGDAGTGGASSGSTGRGTSTGGVSST